MENQNSGHRERLRNRFVKTGHESFADHELLELLLFGVILRRDAKPIAKALLARFGDLSGVIGAPIENLKQIDGVGETIAIHIKAIHSLMVRSEKAELSKNPILGDWSTLLNYLRLDLQHEPREKFRVIFLDKKLRLISDEQLWDGTIDHAPVYPREIARRSLELSAKSVILVHNHPSGDPKASTQDIAMTRKIIAALAPIEVNVIDHLIVGLEGTNSMKALGLF